MKDLRVKLTTKANIGVVLPGMVAGPMGPLIKDNGVVFPYVPTMMFTHQATYGDHSPLHSNFQYRFFRNYSLGDFTVTGTFTGSTVGEIRYTLACHHFFKSVMKMGFGETDDFRGVPPPVLNFSAYGDDWFEKIPCVLTTYNYNLDSNYDYVPLMEGGPIAGMSDARALMPIRIECILTLSPTYNTRETRKQFNVTDFYSGRLLRHGYS